MRPKRDPFSSIVNEGAYQSIRPYTTRKPSYRHLALHSPGEKGNSCLKKRRRADMCPTFRFSCKVQTPSSYKNFRHTKKRLPQHHSPLLGLSESLIGSALGCACACPCPCKFPLIAEALRPNDACLLFLLKLPTSCLPKKYQHTQISHMVGEKRQITHHHSTP